MANFFKAPTDNYVSTTLNGTINDSVTTITLNDASKLQYPGYVVIDREDGNGNPTASSREVVYYTGISGNDLTGCTRGADNSTARSHSDGALVEAVLTVGMWGDLRDAVSAALAGDATGASLAVSTATISGLTHLNQLVVASTASIASLKTQNLSEIHTLAVSSVASISSLSLKTLSATSIASIVRIETDNLAIKYAARVRMASAQNISAATITKLELDTEDYDVGSAYNTGQRRFNAPRPGYYEVRAQARFGVAADADRCNVYIYVNGAETSSSVLNASGTTDVVVPVSDLRSLASGDYVEVFVQNTDNNDTIRNGTGQTFSTIRYIGNS